MNQERPLALMSLPTARRPGHVAIRRGGMALRLNSRVLLLTLIAAGVLFGFMIWAMTLGSYPIAASDVARAITGTGADEQLYVVRELRLPRVLSAALIGGSLAVAGAIFQGLVRNPLVSPDIIGIDSGANLLVIFWFVNGLSLSLLPIAAFAGAIIAAGIIYLLTWQRGIAPNRLILVGIGVGSAVDAATTYFMVRYPLEEVRPAIVWSMGAIDGSNWADVNVLLAVLGIGLPLTLALTWPLRAMQLGDDAARVLGLPLERVRLALIGVGCALAAVSVALAGPIGFVALMVPHFARMVAGPLSGSMILFTAVLGGGFLVLADVVGQHFLPVSLPVGVVTAAVGAPYFLFLLYRTNVRL